MRWRGLVVVLGVAAIAAGVAALVPARDSSPRPLTLATLHLDLSPTPFPTCEGLPETIAGTAFAEHDAWIHLTGDGEDVRASVPAMEGFGVMAVTECTIGGLDAHCELASPDSVCGMGPVPLPLAAANDDIRRLHFAGGGHAELYDGETSLRTRYGPHAAMALDEGVLLVADDVSGHLFAHVLPYGWGELGSGTDLGPSRARDEFGRCDLGPARALYDASGDVLVGAGRRWSRFETAVHDAARGTWSCTPDALSRVDVDRDAGALAIVVCRTDGCAATTVALTDELAGAEAMEAVVVGASVAVLFERDDDLHLSMLGAEGFSPAIVVARRARVARAPVGYPSRDEPSLLVHRGQLYAGVGTILGSAVLVVDGAGRARWVRPPASPAASFVPEHLLPLEEEVRLTHTRLDERFRFTRVDAFGFGRACDVHASRFADWVQCSARTSRPHWPMIEPGATELVGSRDSYVDGGSALLVVPTERDTSSPSEDWLDTRDPIGLGFDATVFRDGRILGLAAAGFGRATVVDRNGTSIVGCGVVHGPLDRRVTLDGAPFAWERTVRFVPDQALVLTNEGLRVMTLATGARLERSALAERDDGESCEHEVELTPLTTLPEPASELSVCPLDHALSFQATTIEDGERRIVAVGVGSAEGWQVHPLAPARLATVGCLWDGVSLVSVEGDRVIVRRCGATCVEESTTVPGLSASALAVDLGDRIALLTSRADGAWVGRFGSLASLADAPEVELVDAGSGFVPIGTDGVEVRPGLALVLGRTPRGIGVLRVESDQRAVPLGRIASVVAGPVERAEPPTP